MKHMPSPLIDFIEGATSIRELLAPRPGYGISDYPWAKSMLGKHPLPVWQRASVWSVADKVSFIESIYLGADLGSVIINGWLDIDGKAAPFSDCLLDGQQRIGSLFDYQAGKFPVFGSYFHELTQRDQARFRNHQIGLKTCKCFDEEILKRVYDINNFAGKRHLESERAIPVTKQEDGLMDIVAQIYVPEVEFQPSQKHIEEWISFQLGLINGMSDDNPLLLEDEMTAKTLQFTR
ncbi:DUF262 domain-containing protein [Enterovibrio norvegicus]|uniref:DUF262 domain-containing protein n=1 Tax=Enterovibrio norvegicus TaxID=188144 RepID=UPI00352E8152